MCAARSTPCWPSSISWRRSNVTGIEPMTSVRPMKMKQRADAVTDGGDADAILKNAPAREGNFFLVPKVVE